MAHVTFDTLQLSVDLDHAETQALLNGGLTQQFSGVLKAALGAAGVAAAAIGPITGVVAGYLMVQMALISRIDQGNGVTLTMPYLAPGLVIPTPRAAMTNTPNSTWAQSDQGVFVSPKGDNVTWQIERGVIQPGVALFRLDNQVPTGWPAGSRPWDKAFLLRDGLGGEWPVKASAHASAENGLYATQLANGQSFSFRKPGGLGGWATAFEISGIQNVHGGDRVTFTWLKDWI